MVGFEDSVRNWVKLDDELRRMNEKIKEIREKRAAIADSIHSYANQNKLTNATINISDGRLKFIETQTSQSLTFKFLQECLEEIIPNKDSVSQIMNHIKSKRAVKYSPEIKRYFTE